MPAQLPPPSRTQLWLIVAILLCYGVGYPLALFAGTPMGWILVGVGGIPLIALGVVTIRRLHLSDSGPERPYHD